MYMSVMAAAVPTDRRDEYLAHAREAAAIMKDHGALDWVECWGESVPDGEVTSFPMAVRCAPGETVVLSWVRWPDKAASEAGMKGFERDPRTAELAMPFDGQRLIHGGFDVVAAG